MAQHLWLLFTVEATCSAYITLETVLQKNKLLKCDTVTTPFCLFLIRSHRSIGQLPLHDLQLLETQNLLENHWRKYKVQVNTEEMFSLYTA
jgi:hypothetical protein